MSMDPRPVDLPRLRDDLIAFADHATLTGVTAPLAWRKSSYSSDTINCVEVAPTPDAVAVRDSKDPDGPILWFGTDAWQRFVNAVRTDAL
jgi:uncharacterized protein DUF397